MKQKNTKTHILTISCTFPSYHPRRGEETGFVEKIENALSANVDAVQIYDQPYKLHTIRGNFPLWQKRIAEVQDGTAVLSLRYWSGKPYNSPQVEFARLTAGNGVGVQMVHIDLSVPSIPNFYMPEYSTRDIDGFPSVCHIPMNDGLSVEDFAEWFINGKYDLSQPMAIIHFTPFRY